MRYSQISGGLPAVQMHPDFLDRGVEFYSDAREREKLNKRKQRAAKKVHLQEKCLDPNCRAKLDEKYAVYHLWCGIHRKKNGERLTPWLHTDVRPNRSGQRQQKDAKARVSMVRAINKRVRERLKA